MKRKTLISLGLGALTAAGLVMFHQSQFASDRLESPLPVSAGAAVPDLTLAWVGRGTVFVRAADDWQRAPTQDYDFTVVQRRFADRWESVKTMHRRNPDYDGAAGSRDQVHFFRVDLGEPRDGKLPFRLDSSMGAGAGQTDPEFRDWRFTLDIGAPDLARYFMPFDRMAFRQDYDYENAALHEDITLLKSGSDEDTPVFRIEEKAVLMRETPLDGPPTRADQPMTGTAQPG